MRKAWARSDLEPGVLVDLTRGLLHRSGLALAAVTSVRHDPAGSLVEIDAPVRPRGLGPERSPVRLASRFSNGSALPMQLRCRGVSLGAVLLPVDVRQGDLLAIAGPNRPQGACLVVGAEVVACPVIQPLAETKDFSGVTYRRARADLT